MVDDWRDWWEIESLWQTELWHTEILLVFGCADSTASVMLFKVMRGIMWYFDRTDIAPYDVSSSRLENASSNPVGVIRSFLFLWLFHHTTQKRRK